MKQLYAVIFLILVSITSFAGEYHYYDTSEIHKTLQRFGRCGDADPVDYEDFCRLINLLDAQRSSNAKPTVEIADDNYYLISVRDNNKGKSCDLHINPHDERCVWASCN